MLNLTKSGSTIAMKRREVLRAGLALGAAAVVPRSAFGANERVTLGIMGVHGRGRSLAQGFSGLPDAQIKYVCDVDSRTWPEITAQVASKQGKAPETVTDFRRILDDKGVDGLIVATPDHWHAMATIHACQAGKDVYVEKPCSHNVVEGRRMIEAARHYNRIVQVGTQRRSSPFFQDAMAYIRSGKLGKVHMAKAINSQRRKNIGHPADEAVPAGVDYDLWTGPAPLRPFNPNRFHYNWHWFWDYGTGDLGNDGVHHVDVARWGLGMSAPSTVSSGGGKLAFDDDQQTPDTQIATFQADDTLLVYEMRLWSPYGEHGSENGNVFYGEKAYMVLGDNGYQVYEKGDKLVDSSAKPKGRGESEHQRNFVDCIKSRARPNCDIEEGHRSAMLCHLANIAQRVGRTVRFEPGTESIRHDDEATKLLSRTYRDSWKLPTIG
jgi:predicted dehydrogenase